MKVGDTIYFLNINHSYIHFEKLRNTEVFVDKSLLIEKTHLTKWDIDIINVK